MEQFFSMVALVGVFIVLIGGLVGYFLPRISRFLGWVVIVGAIPGGIATHHALIRSYLRCGEFIAGVCSMGAVVLGIIMAAVVGAFGFGMVLGPLLAASRKRSASSAGDA